MTSADTAIGDPRELGEQAAALIGRAYRDMAEREAALIERSLAAITGIPAPAAYGATDNYPTAVLPDLWRHDRTQMDEVVHQLAEREIGARIDGIERDARRAVIAIRSAFSAIADSAAECENEIAAMRRDAELIRGEMDEYSQTARTVRIVAETLLLVAGSDGRELPSEQQVVTRAVEMRQACEEVLDLGRSIEASVARELERLAALEQRLRLVRDETIPRALAARERFLATQRRCGIQTSLLMLAAIASILGLVYVVSPVLMFLVAAVGCVAIFLPMDGGTVFTAVWSRSLRRVEAAYQAKKLSHLAGL